MNKQPNQGQFATFSAGATDTSTQNPNAGAGADANQQTQVQQQPAQQSAPQQVGGCDPSYPGVCIPPPPPDLDCKDISFRRFQVVPPDPHNFDGDHDGVGCESG